jgi:hypothetical protein
MTFRAHTHRILYLAFLQLADSHLLPPKNGLPILIMSASKPISQRSGITSNNKIGISGYAAKCWSLGWDKYALTIRLRSIVGSEDEGLSEDDIRAIAKINLLNDLEQSLVR